MRPRERVGEVVRVGLSLTGCLILIAAAIYIGLLLRVAFIEWVIDAR